jgi:methionine-rich copper-binding protein CopC
MKILAATPLALLLFAASAIAHPMPRMQSPKPNAVLSASPTQIRIGFNEGLVAVFSGMELHNSSGKPIALGPATLDPNDDKVLAAPIPRALMPGTYTVKWHAVGDDTHRVEGHYAFKVK